MDRFEAMSAFVAVAKAGSFSAAAREFGIPLATMSRRVADLETELGARLLRRSTRRLSLTDQGQLFYEACSRILDDVRDAEKSVTGEYRTPKGDLTVTAPGGFGRLHLQPIVIEFLAAYPDINLRLMLVDRVVNLVDERVDAAIRIAELADSSLIARALGHVRIVLCALSGLSGTLRRPRTSARSGQPSLYRLVGTRTTQHVVVSRVGNGLDLSDPRANVDHRRGIRALRGRSRSRYRSGHELSGGARRSRRPARRACSPSSNVRALQSIWSTASNRLLP